MAVVKTVFQHSTKPSFLENLAIRPNGHIVATNLLTPDITAVDPSTGESSTIVSIGQRSDGSIPKSLLGITPLSPTSDKYVVAAGDYDLETGPGFNSFGLHLVDLSVSPPKVSVIAETADIGLINGITTWDENTVLVTDCTIAGKIFKVDVSSGNRSVAFEFEELTVPEGAAFPVSVNGIKIFTQGSQRYLYWTNSARGALYRLAVSCTPDMKHDKGQVEVIAQGMSGPDDFCVAEDGTVYIALVMGHRVVKVDKVGGEVQTVAGEESSFEVAGPTAVALDKNRGVLYASTSGGLVSPIDGNTEAAKVVEIKLP